MPISKVIPKTRPTAISADFDRLRAEGIRHLEHLATELWTDYNAHDPGITLLELLCYAITDLGYRTNMLPLPDLLAREQVGSKVWCEAADVLPTSPVTAMDYRKLLIDLPGVKNSWLYKASAESPLASKGLFFPRLMEWNEELKIYQFSAEKLRVFVNSYRDEITGLGTEWTPEEGFYATLRDLLTEEVDQVESFYEIQEYILSIGQSFLDFKQIIGYFLKEHLYNLELYATDEEIVAIIDLIIVNFGEPNLPLIDVDSSLDIAEVLRHAGILLTNYSDLSGFLAAAVDNHDFASNLDHVPEVVDEEDSEVEDTGGGITVHIIAITSDPLGAVTDADGNIYLVYQTNIEQVKSFFRREIEFSKLSDAEKLVVGTVSRSGIFTDLEDNERRRRWLLQEYYKEVTNADNLTFFPAVYAYLDSGNTHLEDFFVNGELNKYFFDYNSNSWHGLYLAAIQQFLNQAFGLVLETESSTIAQIERYYTSNQQVDRKDSDEATIADYILKENFCRFGRWRIIHGAAEEIPRNGLYHILLDLDEDIDTRIPNQVNPIIKAVKERLHENRGLCEDYVDIHIVEQRPIALCLNVEVATEADEIEVVAEALRLMQEHLSPVPRFRTFRQRLEELRAAGANYSAEQIYDGPCLDNGFLVDEELGAAMPISEYYHSDLLNVIMQTEGVLGLPTLRIKPTPEDGSDFSEQTAYPVYGGDYPSPDDGGGSYCKPVIDLRQSYIRVTKGARNFVLNPEAVRDQLDLLRLINDPDPLDEIGGPEWEEGTYRDDLSTYRSLQYDLPDNYLVGDNPPAKTSPPIRRAKAKQLQAYLAFYDQILASYLHQLGQVRQLLSVEQEAHSPTWALPMLYDTPGLRDLIGHHSPFTAQPSDWQAILDRIRDDLTSISKGQGNVEQTEDGAYIRNDRELAKAWVGDLADSETSFEGFLDLEDRLRRQLSQMGLPDTAARRFYDLYYHLVEEHFWKQFVADEENSYAQKLQEIAESPADQQRRKNQLLDHLLARFGESFAGFATALLRPEAEPEDNPRQQSFDEYLAAKTRFLRDVANLAKRRNLGYNYTAQIEAEGRGDIWNTENVPGLQQRVLHRMGMLNWETRALNPEPRYRLDRRSRTNNRGMTAYQIALRQQPNEETIDDNPQQATPLMVSPNYNSARTAQEASNFLYKYLATATFKEAEDSVSKTENETWFRLLETKGGKYRAALYRYEKNSRKKIQQGPGEKIGIKLLLQSELLSEDEARNRILDQVLPLIGSVPAERRHEGFHVVEHILLRPTEPDNALLKLSLGCVLEETPKDPYSFWITVVAPAQTGRFADPDFRAFFERELRLETPAHIAVRFCYLEREDMSEFEEAFGVWRFEKAKCDPPNYCRVDEALNKLVEVMNEMPCGCHCHEVNTEPDCGETNTPQ